MKDRKMEIRQIGIIKNQFSQLEQCPANGWKMEMSSLIVLNKEYSEGLTGLNKGDYIHILWWFDKAPRDILKNKVGSNTYETGVFAMRSPQRPNPIALSLCKIIDMNANILEVVGIEALNDSVILDIKKAMIYKGMIL